MLIRSFPSPKNHSIKEAARLITFFNDLAKYLSLPFVKFHDSVGFLKDGTGRCAIPVLWYIDCCSSLLTTLRSLLTAGSLTILGFLITRVSLITFWFSDYRSFPNTLDLLITLWFSALLLVFMNCSLSMFHHWSRWGTIDSRLGFLIASNAFK